MQDAVGFTGNVSNDG